MMEAASIQTMLERMGFTPEATQFVIGDQGIDSVDEQRNLDDDKATNLCRVLFSLGGPMQPELLTLPPRFLQGPMII